MKECKHFYRVDIGTDEEIWCTLNFDHTCDHLDDPENCEYNIKGIEREEE